MGIFYLASLISISDNITTFTFKYAIPNLISGLFVFGVVPMICKWI